MTTASMTTASRTTASRDRKNPATGDDFLGSWNVIAGSMRRRCDDPFAPIAGETARIEPGDRDGEYELCCLVDGKCQSLQTLRYDERTQTLQNRPGERARCLFLWRDGQPRCIVGIRRVSSARPQTGSGWTLAPWEGETDDGTWGAEEEPVGPPGGD